jgi:hypothetical protein
MTEQPNPGIFFKWMHASYRLMATLTHQRIKTASQRIPDEVDGAGVFAEADFDHNIDNVHEKPKGGTWL